MEERERERRACAGMRSCVCVRALPMQRALSLTSAFPNVGPYRRVRWRKIIRTHVPSTCNGHVTHAHTGSATRHGEKECSRIRMQWGGVRRERHVALCVRALRYCRPSASRTHRRASCRGSPLTRTPSRRHARSVRADGKRRTADRRKHTTLRTCAHTST